MSSPSYPMQEKLTIDQVGHIKSGLVKISARMTTEQLEELVDVLQDIRRVRHQHRAFRSINQWA